MNTESETRGVRTCISFLTGSLYSGLKRKLQSRALNDYLKITQFHVKLDSLFTYIFHFHKFLA